MPLRVRVFDVPGGELAARVAGLWPEADVRDTGEGAEVAVVWDAEPEAVVAFAATQPRLTWLHTKASGLPPTLAATLTTQRDVVVTNGAGTHGTAVAEHVLAVLLALFKQLPALADAQRARQWVTSPGGRELRGARIGVLGLGDLGVSCVRLLRALGADVVGLSRSGAEIAGVSTVHRPHELVTFLDGLDALVVAAPLTEATRAMVGASELARLAPGAVVVNVGRGPVVDEAALGEALRSGRIAGAALDVYDDEPVGPTSPLWELPNLIMTPHCADLTAPTEERCWDLLAENIGRFRAAEPLRNVVDLARGY